MLERLHAAAGHLHFELAYTSVANARALITKRLLPHCDSAGLNEVELRMFAEQEGIICDSEIERLRRFT